MGLICPLAAHLRQCQRSLCLHPVSKLLLLCFCIASSWLWQFLWEDRRAEVFAPSSLCVWSQMPWRSLQIIVLPWQIVKTCDVMNQFLWKPFWFFLRTSQFQVLCGWVADHCKSWLQCKNYTLVVLGYSGIAFLGIILGELRYSYDIVVLSKRDVLKLFRTKWNAFFKMNKYNFNLKKNIFNKIEKTKSLMEKMGFFKTLLMSERILHLIKYILFLTLFLKNWFISKILEFFFCWEQKVK